MNFMEKSSNHLQIDLRRGLPSNVKILHEVSLQVLEEARTRQNLESFNSSVD